jgi:hypothetical protein
MEQASMTDRTPWLKRVGALWLVVGGASLVWAFLTLARGFVSRSIPTFLAFLAPLMLPRLLLWPWGQLAVAFAAFFFLVSGMGLLRRQRWTQTLLVPAHLLFAIYAFAVWVASFMVKQHLYEGWAAQSLGLLAFIALNGALAFWMNSVGTSEALSWLPLRTAPLIPLKCEFCGTPLDPASGRCPHCEVEPQIAGATPPKPPDAMLIGASDEREYYITPDHAVIIGRGSTRNEINLSNPTVSRRHAQITFEGERYVLKALDDRNGTFVNNTRIRQQTLHDGDRLRFGRASYDFKIVE